MTEANNKEKWTDVTANHEIALHHARFFRVDRTKEDWNEDIMIPISLIEQLQSEAVKKASIKLKLDLVSDISKEIKEAREKGYQQGALAKFESMKEVIKQECDKARADERKKEIKQWEIMRTCIASIKIDYPNANSLMRYDIETLYTFCDINIRALEQKF